MPQAYIGYSNLFLQGTVTASSAASGYPAANALDWLTYDFWKPTGTSSETVTVVLAGAQAVDFIGVAAHNFATSRPTIYFERWSGAAWVTVDTFSPTTNAPIFRLFASVSATQYRFRFTSATTAVMVGVLCAGAVLAMPAGVPVGHTPITMAQEVQYIDNMSEGGQWLGRSIISQGIETTAEFRFLAPAWVAGAFDTFRQAARRQGFFWAWAMTSYPAQVAYVWLTKEPRPQHVRHGAKSMDVTLEMRGTWDVL